MKIKNRVQIFFNLLTLLALSLVSTASFAKTHAQEVYSATVDDGTAHEIGSHCNIETNCAISSKMPKVVAPRKELKRLPPVVLNKPKLIVPASTAMTMPKRQVTVAEAPAATATDTVQTTLPAHGLSPISEPDLLEAHFDAVPKDKVAEISERMIYSYEILKRFGRAYDYRSTKLGDLKRILKDLERTNQTAKN